MSDDLVSQVQGFLLPCGSCDAGLPMPCTCRVDDYRPTMARLLAEVERLRVIEAELGDQARRANYRMDRLRGHVMPQVSRSRSEELLHLVGIGAGLWDNDLFMLVRLAYQDGWEACISAAEDMDERVDR